MVRAFVERVARAARTAARGRRGGPWQIRTDPVRGRRRALDEEIGYWAEWLDTRGGRFSDDFARRFEPDAEVEDGALRAVLAGVPGTPSVLDVGAGPVSSVGARLDGRALDLVPVDPLADAYDGALRRRHLVPPVRTQRVAGEALTRTFGEGRFDVAYARNSLDHAVDPVAVVEEMLRVVPPDDEMAVDDVACVLEPEDDLTMVVARLTKR